MDLMLPVESAPIVVSVTAPCCSGYAVLTCRSVRPLPGSVYDTCGVSHTEQVRSATAFLPSIGADHSQDDERREDGGADTGIWNEKRCVRPPLTFACSLFQLYSAGDTECVSPSEYCTVDRAVGKGDDSMMDIDRSPLEAKHFDEAPQL